MDAAAEELADRIRALLPADQALEERRMFGTRAFLLNERILVCARKNGVLLVRVTDENGATLLSRDGVKTAVMGARSMGPSWLDVSPEVIGEDGELMFWLDVAREDNAAVGS